MLVLSRKRGEQIVIPTCAVKVTVLSVRGNTVRLGISAPAETEVHREEIWRRTGLAVERARAAEEESREGLV